MMDLCTCHDPPCTGMQVAVFGVGVVGSAIINSVRELAPGVVETIPIHWESPQDYRSDMEHVFSMIRERLRAERSGTCPGVHVVWSAGKAGFGATAQEIERERQGFEIFLGHLRALQGEIRDAPIFLHHVSSLGGLFEGQRFITHESRPACRRPYGNLKLAQEAAVMALPDTISRRIYRLSSVVAPATGSQRVGLVARLVRDGLMGETSTIVGRKTTLRDYVWHGDIGRFVAQNIVASKGISRSLDQIESRPYVLASGKPTSISEMIANVETIIGRRLLVRESLTPTNDADITVDRHALPQGWHPTDLLTCVSHVARSMFHSICTHS